MIVGVTLLLLDEEVEGERDVVWWCWRLEVVLELGICTVGVRIVRVCVRWWPLGDLPLCREHVEKGLGYH